VVEVSRTSVDYQIMDLLVDLLESLVLVAVVLVDLVEIVLHS
jgi:hypothetical protein